MLYFYTALYTVAVVLGFVQSDILLAHSKTYKDGKFSDWNLFHQGKIGTQYVKRLEHFFLANNIDAAYYLPKS